MAEYIDREAAIQWLEDMQIKHPKKADAFGVAKIHFKHLPAADVRENVSGEWIKMDMHMGMENYKCSVCRSECYVPEVMGEPMFPLCPYCGAQMMGGAENAKL